MNIFSKMDNLLSLTENEKILVSYIKENPEAFVKMTSAEISEASFISNATIYRLCKKMDLAGLSELKILVSASVGDYLKERKTLDFNYPIHPNETQYQITRTMQELYEQTVVSSLNNLDLEQLRQAASLMKKVPSIDQTFITVFAGLPLHQLFQTRLRSQCRNENGLLQKNQSNHLVRFTKSTRSSERILSVFKPYGCKF